MPTDPRPQEISRWFKHGRRFAGKNVPTVDSIERYEETWVQWWKAGQPRWRDTNNWPFERGDATGEDWGHLLDGGKDGLFLIVVSLACWVYAGSSSEQSKLDEAIVDVTWVLDGLITRLSADATTSDTPPATSSTTQRRVRTNPSQYGRSAKRARLQE
jgi:hypothetical protein